MIEMIEMFGMFGEIRDVRRSSENVPVDGSRRARAKLAPARAAGASARPARMKPSQLN